MNASRLASRLRQQGMVTTMAVIFLIAVVIFALSQTLGITGSNSIDNKRQMDSVAALFLAESGLERAMGILSSASGSGTMDNSVCSNIASGGPFPLGRGSFDYVSAIPGPAICIGTACMSCSVRVTGTVDSASRTLDLGINLTSVNGTSGFGTNVTMALKNTYTVDATSVFNLAWRRQGGTTGEVVAGGNATAAICTLASCGLQWNVESSSGSPSGGSMGVSVGIPASTNNTVTQTISTNRNYAEVGGLFPGLAGSPPIIGSYWNDGGGGNGTKTVNNSNTTPSSGQTNSGVATSGTCPSATNSTGTSQTCTSWCSGADTLVFGVSARSTTFADSISNVTFNTNGSPLQNVALTQIAHFPNTSGDPASTGDIYSEIWYAYNPNYLSSPLNASSGGVATGSIGVLSFAATLTSASPVMNVTSLSGFLHVGDTVACTSGGTCGFSPTTIAAVPGGGVTSSATGNYTLSSPSTVTRTRDFQTSSNYLDVSAVSSNFLKTNETITGTNVSSVTSITSVVGAGNVPGAYGVTCTPSSSTCTTSGQQSVGSTTIFSSGNTIYIPGGTVAPVAGTIVSVFSGTGQFQAKTMVASSPAPTATLFYVVDNIINNNPRPPTVRLSADTICGGICAFFDNPSSTSLPTEFTVTRTAGTTQWGGGFTCLSGVDEAKIKAVSSSLTSASTWREVVR